jgi:putative methyltransferase
MLKIERKAKSNADLIESSKEDGVKIDRFLRVNTMKTTIDKFVQQMKDENFPLQDAEPCIKRDEHVPELFKLYPSNTPVHNLSCVKDATCIVQDKASCLPVHVMFQELPKILKNDEPIHIIDGCAAPGNKTTYLAAKLSSMFTNSSNTIHAFDRDTKRVKVLSDRVKEANAHKIVNVVHGDFSKVDPNDPTYSQVRAILLDPSCSGSGIVSRDGSVGQESDAVDESRLLNLSKFQATLVNHALQCKEFTVFNIFSS